MSTQILRLPAVVARVGLSKSPLYAKIKAGEFPKPVPLSNQAVGWLESEVEAWLQERIKQRDAVAA